MIGRKCWKFQFEYFQPMILFLFQWIFRILFPTRNPITRVILLLNTDVIRPIQIQDRDQLTLTSLPNEDLKNGKIGLELERKDGISLVGHVNENTLGFIMNKLIENNIPSIVMLKKNNVTPPQPPKEEIFNYKPSRAEREYLERI